MNVQSWRIESVWIRLFFFVQELKTFQNQKPPATTGVEMRAVEGVWPMPCEVTAHDTDLMLYPPPSVDKASLLSAQHRPTLHRLNLPEVGLCLVHQYRLQTSQ